MSAGTGAGGNALQDENERDEDCEGDAEQPEAIDISQGSGLPLNLAHEERVRAHAAGACAEHVAGSVQGGIELRVQTGGLLD